MAHRPRFHGGDIDSRRPFQVSGRSTFRHFFPVLQRLRAAGWSVVGFEGPGQGRVLEEQRAPMTPDWHQPVAAVLDAFALDDVTLVGISLGGCLAIRAAARAPRVRRVVAFDALTDFLDAMLAQRPPVVRHLFSGLEKAGVGGVLDRPLRALARRSPIAEWGLEHAMRVFGADTPAAALAEARRYRTGNVSHRARQDVLVLGGARDHYAPVEQIWAQGRSLINARSVTVRVFSAEEQAHAHCQVGNLPLALDVIASWLAAEPDAPLPKRNPNKGPSVADLVSTV